MSPLSHKVYAAEGSQIGQSGNMYHDTRVKRFIRVDLIGSHKSIL